MDNPPELWAFLLANTWLFIFSSVLTGLCYLTHRRSGGQRSYLMATAGFGLVVLGGLVEPLYQFHTRDGYYLAGTELLWLQASEGALIATGLGLLFCAVVRYSPGPSTAGDDRPAQSDEDVLWGAPRWDD